MRYILTSFLFLAVFSIAAKAQEATDVHIYDPKADAFADIHNAVSKASKENKHVLLQIGGNWCVWCRRFNTLITTDPALKGYIDSNYVIVHVNYSPENKNLKVLESLGYPQRFGFPVFVILDGKGTRLHTQNSSYVEEGPGHSPKKVGEFLHQWSPAALNPGNYNK